MAGISAVTRCESGLREVVVIGFWFVCVVVIVGAEQVRGVDGGGCENHVLRHVSPPVRGACGHEFLQQWRNQLYLSA